MAIITTLYSFTAYDKLIEICQNNVEHFERDETKTGQRFLNEFHNIIGCVMMARNYVTKYIKFVHEYDFDEYTRANGYRSAIKAMNDAINHTVKICKQVSQKRNSVLFWKSSYVKEVEACTQLLNSLCCYLEELLKIRENSKPGSLFQSGEHKASDFFESSGKINLHPFYGRCIAFQYCKSVKLLMKNVGLSIVGFSEVYFNSNSNRIMKATSTMFSGSKYVWNPELRAERFVNVSRYGGIEFSKAYLAFTELEFMYTATTIMAPRVSVNRLIKIHPELFEMENAITPNKMVQIPVPSSHLPTGPINARLLSRERRVGMIGVKNKKHIHSESKSLIIHCHGGGFVGTSSKSHEMYLREWAVQLHVPILSIDYSLSPEAPYPRALEEVYYVYCWAIRNARSLGTTAEKVIVIGDSAGATLTLTLALKCIEQQIRRPDGVFLCYCPMNFAFTPTPARFLSLMDVLSPCGVLLACLKAYVCQNRKEDTNNAPNSIDNNNSMWNHVHKYLNEQAERTQNDEMNNANASGSLHSSSISDGEEMSLEIQTDEITAMEQNAVNAVNQMNRKCLKTLMKRNPADDYLFDVPHDPFLSPLCASDEMLKHLPTVKIMSSDVDPFLDDCVEMAKRLKRLDVSTELNVASGLPHGFLNFVPVCKDAREFNQILITQMSQLMDVKVKETP